MLILPDIIPFCAATRRNRNLVADDCAAVALERIEPNDFDDQPVRPPPRAKSPPALAAYHGYLFSQGAFHPATWEARAVAISERRRLQRSSVAQLHHSLSKDDDEPPHLVSGDEPPQLVGGDTMAAGVIERMERKGASAGPPVICRAHVLSLGRGQAASYGAPCTNQAAELNSREQRKAEAGAPPVLIPELDQQRLISSKVSSICFSLCLSSHCGPPQSPGPPRRRHHPSKTTRRQVHLSISVWTAYTTQLILHSVSC